MLLPNISQQEDKQLRAEIADLKEQRKKIEAVAAEARSGVSFYGSYFTTSQ
jgi:cell division protein FtsB